MKPDFVEELIMSWGAEQYRREKLPDNVEVSRQYLEELLQNTGFTEQQVQAQDWNVYSRTKDERQEFAALYQNLLVTGTYENHAVVQQDLENITKHILIPDRTSDLKNVGRVGGWAGVCIATSAVLAVTYVTLQPYAQEISRQFENLTPLQRMGLILPTALYALISGSIAGFSGYLGSEAGKGIINKYLASKLSPKSKEYSVGFNANIALSEEVWNKLLSQKLDVEEEQE